MGSNELITPVGTESHRGWLDRPVLAGARIDRWALVCALLVAAIVFTRLWDLGSRAYSHDESIHAWEAWKLTTGQGYTHSPVYHGPFLYHMTALVYLLFGDSDVTGRLATAVAGIAIALSPLAMRKWLGKQGAFAAMALMAVSPVLMHRARFIRHDQFAILFNLILVIVCLRYLEERKPRYLYVAAAAVALGFAAKETTFITYAILGTFLVGFLLYQWLSTRDLRLSTLIAMPAFDLVVTIGTLILPFASPVVITLLGHDPLDYTTGPLLFSLGIALVMFGIGAGIGMWWGARRWMACAGIFWAVFLPFFTTMFTNGGGIATGVLGQLGYWLSQHGESRGGQPWHYYLVLTVVYEFLPFLLALAGVALYALKGDSVARAEGKPQLTSAPYVPLLIYWFLLAFVIYSWAGEKMPWLLQHISVPMTLLGGWALGWLLRADWPAVVRQRGLWVLGLVPLEIWTLARLAALSPSTDTSTQALSDTMLWIVTLAMGLALALAIGWLLSRLRRSDSWRMLSLSLVTVLMALTVRSALRLSFVNGDSAAELLVYAQGAPDAGIVAREIESMSRRLTGGLHLSIAHDNETSWPFVWYLRNYDHATYFGEAPSGPLDADVVLVGTANEDATAQFLAEGYVRSEYRMIWWPYQDWYMQMTPASLWQDLSTAEGRRVLWDILFYRKWDRDLTDWPYVSRFAMYVRRDVLQRMWDGGTDALTALEPVEPSPYLERWISHSAVRSIGSAGSAEGQVLSPKGVAVDTDGNIYVADSQNHRIQVFSPSGAPLRQWGGFGAGPGDFQEPWGVAVAQDGTVYVADTWNHRIQVFDAQGTYLREWGTFGEAGQDPAVEVGFYGPRGLALDTEGNLYVSDTGNKRVLKYSPEGVLLGAVGGSGDGPGQFEEPVGLAFGATGELYVADTWNRRIQVFDAKLTYLREWRVQAWSSLSVVNKPYLAVDGSGMVWATDPESNRILGFSDGEIAVVFGQYGSGLEGMDLPTGLAIDQNGQLYLGDSENGRVLVYSAPVVPQDGAEAPGAESVGD
ncbi:MAG: TIGR03663 family protein [Chloroflexi bacterium]|nr:TIGR03663 family protein [Chloroflexota bacterium]